MSVFENKINELALEVRAGLFSLTNDNNPDRFGFNKTVNVESEELIRPLMEELMIRPLQRIKSTVSADNKSKIEYAATSNPSIVVKQESSTDDGSDWNVKSRDIIVAGYQWMKTEGLING